MYSGFPSLSWNRASDEIRFIHYFALLFPKLFAMIALLICLRGGRWRQIAHRYSEAQRGYNKEVFYTSFSPSFRSFSFSPISHPFLASWACLTPVLPFPYGLNLPCSGTKPTTHQIQIPNSYHIFFIQTVIWCNPSRKYTFRFDLLVNMLVNLCLRKFASNSLNIFTREIDHSCWVVLFLVVLGKYRLQ